MIDEIKIQSLASGEEITLGVNDWQKDYWLASDNAVDWGQVEGQHNSYTSSNLIGGNITSTTILQRLLSITGWAIEDETPLQSRCDKLNRFISPTQDYLLKYKGYQIKFRPDTSVKYGHDYTVNNIAMRQFLIQATCPNPLFSQIAPTVVPFDFSNKKFKFPTDFGQSAPIVFALTETLYNTSIYNSGGFATGVTIKIKFIGEVSNPKIRDLKTNQMIGVNYHFVIDDILTIITVDGSKSMTVKHGDERTENLIKYRHIETEWLQLAAGENIWAIECENPEERKNMKVEVSFNVLYLEVE